VDNCFDQVVSEADDCKERIGLLANLREDDRQQIYELNSRFSEFERQLEQIVAEYVSDDDKTDGDEEEEETDHNVSNTIFFLALLFKSNMSILFATSNRLI
jgi:hypothetical protein